MKMKRSKGVFEKLLTIHFMAILFLMAIVAYFSCWKNYHESKQSMAQYGRLAASTMRNMAVDPIVGKIAFDRLHNLVNEIDNSSQDIVDVLIYNADGVPVAFSFSEKDPESLTVPDIEMFSQLPMGTILEGSSSSADLYFAAALSFAGKNLGFVRICMSTARLRSILFWDAMFYLGVSLLAMAVSGFVYLYFTKLNVVQPLQKIASSMEGFRLNRDIDTTELLDGLVGISACKEIDQMRQSFGSMVRDIKESADIILRKESQVRLLLNSTAEAIYGLDVDGRCTFCNASFLRIVGYKNEEELLGRRIHDVIKHTRPDGSPFHFTECDIYKGITKGHEIHNCGELFRSNGTTLPVEYWSHPVIQDGEVSGAVVTFIDISKRQEAEAARRVTEKRLRSIIDNSMAIVFLKDLQGRFITVNKRFEELFSGTEKNIIGKTDYDLFPVEIADSYRVNDVMVAEKKEPCQMEELIPQEGVIHTYISTKFPLYNDENSLYAIGGIATDISDIKAVERKLADEKEQLAVTLSSIGDGVITTDTIGMVVLINKVAEELTGWKQGDAVGKPLTDIFHIINEKTRKLCENPVDKVLTTGGIIGLANHTALIAKDGTERSIADSGAPIRDQENDIVGVVLVFRDVTSQLRTEQELVKVKKLESIGILAGGIAHDFNNILSAVLGNINLAMYDKSLSESTRALLAAAEKASQRATSLTGQLLTFAKGGEPIKAISSLAGVVRDSAMFVLRGDNTDCHFTIPDDLWMVNIDKGQISQVVQNIVINAGQASRPEGGTISVVCENVLAADCPRVPVLHSGKFVKISIRDSGVGMPDHVVEKIFDPYFTTKTAGSGLGLAITHSIINRHDGYISVESQPGIGTQFTLYLPAADEETERSPQPEEQKSTASQHVKVLVMDDDEMIRGVAGAMLTKMGCETAFVKEGVEAVQLYREALDADRKFDVVIMDLTIPGGMGGKEAVQEIIAIDPSAKVIVASGYSNDPIMANCREYGFCGSMIKPFKFQDLAGIIDRFTS